MKEKKKFLEFCDKHRKGIAVIIAWAIFMVCMSIFGVGLKHWYGHQATSEGWEYAHEVFFGIALVIPTWFITMYTYIYFRQKFAHTKYAVEVLFISLVIVAGVMMLLCAAGVGNDGIKGVFGSIYTAIGSFAFEGLTDKIADTHLATWFYGWAIYAGLTFLGIITTKSSYEVFSRIKLVLLPEEGKDVYIFSALTEETLALADSIVDENCKKRQKEIQSFYEYKQMFEDLRGINDELKQLNSKRKRTVKDEERKIKLEGNKKETEARINELKDAPKKVREITKPCVIVFAGPSLKPFERKDELCIQVMAKGYLYWTFSKGNKKSIAENLHLNNKNAGDYNRRFVIFAFATENDVPAEEDNMDIVFQDVPAEEDNMDIVFQDVQKRIEREKEDKYNNLRIEYYILTKRTINYPAYDYKNRELIFEYFKASNHSKKMDEKQIEDFGEYITSSKNERKNKKTTVNNQILLLQEVESEYYDRFIINVWSEACAVAKDAARDSTELIQNRIASWETGNNNSSEQKTEDKGQPEQKQKKELEAFNIWCLGFGSTAQEVAKALYAQTSYIDKEGTSPKVNIWAFDKKMDEIEGLFKMEHPCLIFEVNDIQNNIVVDAQIDAIANAKSISQDYIREEMSYPIFHFKKLDCRSNEFLEQFDTAIGKTDKENTKQPDVFVIAMGDDYANIRIANAIIQDTVNEANTEKKQIIFVNVWDSKNNDLLLTCGGKKERRRITINDNLDVYIIGNNEDVYTYKKIVDVEEPSEYHANYKMIEKFTELIPGWTGIRTSIENWCQAHNITNTQLVVDQSEAIITNCEHAVHQGTGCQDITINNTTIKADDCEKAIVGMFKHLMAGIEHKAGMEAYVATILESTVGALLSSSNIPVANIPPALIASVFGVCNAMGNKKNKIKIYNSLDAWLKESNKLADIFAPVMASIIANPSSTSDYHRLSKIEHQRWCRVHWANGWIYRDINEKDELKRHHKCLLPYRYVGNYDYLYDTINVLLALAKK